MDLHPVTSTALIAPALRHDQAAPERKHDTQPSAAYITLAPYLPARNQSCSRARAGLGSKYPAARDFDGDLWAGCGNTKLERRRILAAESSEVAEGIFLRSALSACSVVTSSIHPKLVLEL